ncbi:hypothetical protein SXCC_04647 [Gluconacetobacter sp. SXCC-1]|nr:hypothetical protein SXCC_04647 [Gluconacetobacter sp. SXCC-1]
MAPFQIRRARIARRSFPIMDELSYGHPVPVLQGDQKPNM